MATINLPFAASATRRAPTSDELVNGFSCGDADKQLFDWLAWWETAQIASAISAAGLAVDDTDIDRLARAIQLGSNYAVATGTANAWVVGPSLAPLAYAAGLPFDIIAPATNTSTTVNANISSLGNKRIKKRDGSDPAVGDLVSGTLYRCVYDGTNIRVQMPLPSETSVPRGGIQFTASGTLTIPDGVTRIKLMVWGAGAGGGGINASGGAGGGGGGGEYREGWFTVVPGATYAVTIGAGGNGGSNAGTNGSNGGSTSVGALITAAGGLFGAGASGTYGMGGLGGSGGSGGSFNQNGGNGSNGGNLGSVTSSGTGGGGREVTNHYLQFSAGAGGDALFHGQGGNGATGGVGAAVGGNGKAGLVKVEW